MPDRRLAMKLVELAFRPRRREGKLVNPCERQETPTKLPDYLKHLRKTK